VKIAGYETHPAADVFPLMEGEELQKLADDIRANGQRDAIVLHENRILDGRNRYLACLRAGVTPRFVSSTRIESSLSPIAYVVSYNLRRRHLDASQRAMIGAELIPLFKAEAKERQRAAGGAHPGPLPANLPEPGEAREKVAEAMNVSPRSVETARRVLQEAPPEVVEAVKAGRIAVSAAAKATREALRKERAKDDELHFRKRRRLSGSASRIPASIPKHARTSIPEFAAFISSRFTSTDRVRLARLLLGEGSAEGAA
jgi:hypothetical protein